MDFIVELYGLKIRLSLKGDTASVSVLENYYSLVVAPMKGYHTSLYSGNNTCVSPVELRTFSLN